jgi:hypothetical protein
MLLYVHQNFLKGPGAARLTTQQPTDALASLATIIKQSNQGIAT